MAITCNCLSIQESKKDGLNKMLNTAGKVAIAYFETITGSRVCNNYKWVRQPCPPGISF